MTDFLAIWVPVDKGKERTSQRCVAARMYGVNVTILAFHVQTTYELAGAVMLAGSNEERAGQPLSAPCHPSIPPSLADCKRVAFLFAFIQNLALSVKPLLACVHKSFDSDQLALLQLMSRQITGTRQPACHATNAGMESDRFEQFSNPHSSLVYGLHHCKMHMLMCFLR